MVSKIKNKRQYKITKEWLDKFHDQSYMALILVMQEEAKPNPDKQKLALLDVQYKAVLSQYLDLKQQVEDYERRKSVL